MYRFTCSLSFTTARVVNSNYFGADTPLNQYKDRFGTYPYEVFLLPKKRDYLTKHVVRPRLRQYLAKGVNGVDYVVMEKGDRQVSWTELFYDLVFVGTQNSTPKLLSTSLAIAGVISHLTHGLSTEHDSAIVFGQYAVMFLASTRQPHLILWP